MTKRWLVACPLLVALPFGAQAQSSVTLYGIVDAAVALEDTGEPGRGSRKVLNSGNQSSSRLGFRGSEDLGAGLKAVFNLESGVSLDTGAADSAFFGRRAVVGLEGGFGALMLGREYAPIAAVAGAADIMGQGFFGTNLGAFASNRLTRRLSNSVTYVTPRFNGLRASIAASPSEGASGATRVLGSAVEFNAGRLYAGGGYHDVERLNGLKDKEYALGFGYGIGDVDVKGNYLVADPSGAGNKFEQFNIGASIGLGKGRLFGNVQSNRLEGGAKGTALAATYSYELSRRTNVYASYARLSNNASGRFGLNSSSTSVTPAASAPGADPSVMALGVRHRF
ncbi:MAG: porin [Burkholderiales bacterium]|jgi:predicted porin|uniref:Putative porin n=1 Tax=Inhella inkyongensis TaxID=392593 RepID=A0A840S9D8_9BURK|nr:porin [Inhella inkyongensis]MBB5205404.1 putative porin [Inhella inkyongensis]MBN8503154.1 porin [Burkholderiales bacterium]